MGFGRYRDKLNGHDLLLELKMGGCDLTFCSFFFLLVFGLNRNETGEKSVFGFQVLGSEFWDVSLKFLKYFFTDIRPLKQKKNIKNFNLKVFQKKN